MGRWLWPQRPWWAAHGLGAGPVRRAEEAPSLCGQDPGQPPNAQPTMRCVKLGPGQSQGGDGVWAHREALSPGGPCRVQGAGLATLAGAISPRVGTRVFRTPRGGTGRWG